MFYPYGIWYKGLEQGHDTILPHHADIIPSATGRALDAKSRRQPKSQKTQSRDYYDTDTEIKIHIWMGLRTGEVSRGGGGSHVQAGAPPTPHRARAWACGSSPPRREGGRDVNVDALMKGLKMNYWSKSGRVVLKI